MNIGWKNPHLYPKVPGKIIIKIQVWGLNGPWKKMNKTKAYGLKRARKEKELLRREKNMLKINFYGLKKPLKKYNRNILLWLWQILNPQGFLKNAQNPSLWPKESLKKITRVQNHVLWSPWKIFLERSWPMGFNFYTTGLKSSSKIYKMF